MARAVRVAREGWIDAIDGSHLAVSAPTVCLHGDSPNALDIARTVTRRLDEAGVRVARLREIVDGEVPTGIDER